MYGILRMNPVEIEEAVSRIAEAPFNPGEFPFEFLQAFENRDVTIKRLRKDNRSDVSGAVLQRNNIHLVVCPAGQVAQTLNLLRDSLEPSGWLRLTETGLLHARKRY